MGAVLPDWRTRTAARQLCCHTVRGSVARSGSLSNQGKPESLVSDDVAAATAATAATVTPTATAAAAARAHGVVTDVGSVFRRVAFLRDVDDGKRDCAVTFLHHLFKTMEVTVMQRVFCSSPVLDVVLRSNGVDHSFTWQVVRPRQLGVTCAATFQRATLYCELRASYPKYVAANAPTLAEIF